MAGCVGDPATLSVTAEGDALTYTWYKLVGSTWQQVASGPTLSSLVFNPVTLAHDGVYKCVVSNSCGSDESCPIHLEVGQQPYWITPPSSVTLCASPTTQTVFTANAGGVPAPTIKWYDPDMQYITSGPTLSMIVTSTTKVGQYYVLLDNGGACGFGDSFATLTVHTKPVFGVQPPATPIELCEGSALQDVFTVSASGTPTPTYTWYDKDTDLQVGTGATLKLILDPLKTGAYYCMADSGVCEPTRSNDLELVVKTPPTITVPPPSTPVERCVSQPGVEQILFSCVATGETTPTITWYSPTGQQFVGSTLQKVVTPADAGQWTVVASTGCPPDDSSVAQLIVNTAPVIQGQPTHKTACNKPEEQDRKSVV